MSVAVNGRKSRQEPRAGYIELETRAGDVVTLTYVFRTRVVRHPSADKVAVFRGPWLLGVDEAASPAFFDEPSNENRVMLPPQPAARVAMPQDFSAPAGHLEVRYLPGGYPMQPRNALLRPIAEHTGTPDGNPVQWWLPVANP